MLASSSRTPDAYTPKHLAERIINSKAALEGERKQVTVLFADLKGSMELLAHRDREEARKILDPVVEYMMEAVHRFEGTINQVMGDGIMALFGAPIAHGDHAVRACYAALRMQESVKRYAEGVRGVGGRPVQIRVGMNSGQMVVGSIRSDLHTDYTAVAETTHLGARMEQLALPGTPGTYLEDWTAMARAGVTEARRLLRKVSVERIVFRPTPRASDLPREQRLGRQAKMIYERTGEASLSKLFRNLIHVNCLVAPTGFEPVFQP